MHCCSYFYHVVSYGSIITILLEKQKIPLNRETMPIKVFTKKILGHKGLDVSSDMLRFKEFGVLAEKKKPDKKKRKIGGTNIDAAVIERLDTLENTLDKMYKLIEGMSKSYASKKTQLSAAKDATSSADPRLPVDPMSEDQDNDDEEDEEGAGSSHSSSHQEENDDASNGEEEKDDEE
ncbi:hypothetical protein BVRB_3g070360 [Beta vulgaris subsp. vulgaris]|uniref:Uncharacterized protein n=1 Tax=Beta vulgaris subsp. vulgaris TaxID=3555 RepID=A0A0J8BF30_BETVV|nr:hypothetical protein BVRB_3g070360 [Beta vulgaris subsp. vulgaris]